MVNAQASADADGGIDGDLTIRHAARRQAQLLDWLARAGPDEPLDVGQVSACDTAGLQLLLGLRQSRSTQGRPLVLHHVAPALAGVLALCGLTEALPASTGDTPR